jgi:hypothetical protein
LQGQNQYDKYINKANEIRESFMNRKQVRYLGIVIEKDEEYCLSNIDSKRVYIPTKGKYMEAVKSSRVLFTNVLERNKSLSEIHRTLKKLENKQQELKQIKMTKTK